MGSYTYLFCVLLATHLFLCSTQESKLDICRGLVLQGGSDHGAYQAGALQGLISQLGPEAIAYDVVSGVTIGAVNAAWITQFPKGEEQPMVDEIANFWLTLKASNVYHDWLGGIIQGLLFEPSLYNTKAGMNYLKSHITASPRRYVAIGAANANDGSFRAFNNFKSSLLVDDLLNAVMASMGMGGVFPYVEIEGSAYFDGSPLKSMDVASVVNQCRELNGNVDSNIVIDIIMLAGNDFAPKKVDNLNTIQVLLRTLALTSHNNVNYAYIRAKETFPKVQFRYVVQPSTPLPPSDMPVSFNHAEIVQMMNQGEQDAVAAIKKGEGVTFDEIVERAYQKRDAKYGANTRSRDELKKYFAELNDLLLGKDIVV